MAHRGQVSGPSARRPSMQVVHTSAPRRPQPTQRGGSSASSAVCHHGSLTVVTVCLYAAPPLRVRCPASDFSGTAFTRSRCAHSCSDCDNFTLVPHFTARVSFEVAQWSYLGLSSSALPAEAAFF